MASTAPSPLTVRLGMAVTLEEEAALKRIATLWPDKYLGKSSVLRDYTPSQAVEFVRRLENNMTATPEAA